jgi:hypothetical protein
LRFLLSSVWTTTAPTVAFATAVLANVNTLLPNEYATYQKLFQSYANAPGANTATMKPNTSYCNALTLPGFDPTTQDCAETFRGSGSLLSSEWILAGRLDRKIGNSDNAHFRYKLDHGLQPTYIDHISPNFDSLSSLSTGISHQGRKGGALAPPFQGPRGYPHVPQPAQSRTCRTVRAAGRKGRIIRSSGGAEAPPFRRPSRTRKAW